MRSLMQAALDYRMASPIGVYPIPWGWLIVDNRSLACDWAQSLASNMGVSSTGGSPVVSMRFQYYISHGHPWRLDMGPSDDHGNMSSHNRNEHVQTSNIFVMQLCMWLWYPNWDIGNSTLMIYTRSPCRSCHILCMIYIYIYMMFHDVPARPYIPHQSIDTGTIDILTYYTPFDLSCVITLLVTRPHDAVSPKRASFWAQDALEPKALNQGRKVEPRTVTWSGMGQQLPSGYD